MNRPACLSVRRGLGLTAVALALTVALTRSPEALAFPPAPHHLITGLVRDEYGTPINTGNALVILETSSGVRIQAHVIPDLEPGVNYRLEVPMDSGLTAQPYTPTALRPLAPFRLQVKIGNTTYLPIEMKGDYAQLGKPGKRTNLNLTLGEDANGDGLPDAWQRMINADLSKVTPDGDSDGDGLSNLQEYLAGTYAYDPADGFRLEILRVHEGQPVLEFMAITGRTYTLEGSVDLQTWSPLVFRIPAEGTSAANRQAYLAGDVRQLQIEVPSDPPQPAAAYFRLIVH